MFAWRLMPGLREILIATASASAVRDQDALAGSGEVGDGFAGVFVVGDGAYRHEQSHVVAGVAGAIRAFPVAAAVGFEFAVVAIAQQRVVVWIGFKVDAAAAAAIAAGRSAARNIFFAAERNTTVASVAGFYIDFGFINEHLEESYQETCAADFKLRSFAYPHRYMLGTTTRYRSTIAQSKKRPGMTGPRIASVNNFKSRGINPACQRQAGTCQKKSLVDGGGFGWRDADEASTAAAVFELDVAGDEREQRVVFALSDVLTRLVLRAALANQNRASVDQLASEALYPEPLAVRIAAVC